MENHQYALYYNGENECPFDNDKKRMYWHYEKSYFTSCENSNEEEFKDYMINVIDKLSEHFMSFDKALKDYFENAQKNSR